MPASDGVLYNNATHQLLGWHDADLRRRRSHIFASESPGPSSALGIYPLQDDNNIAGPSVLRYSDSISRPISNVFYSSQVANDGGTHASSMPATFAQGQTHVHPDINLPKWIGRLVSLTDRVLTKHAQLQHEGHALEQCEEYLHDSAQALMTAVASQLSSAHGLGAKKKRRKHKRRSQGSQKLIEDGHVEVLDLAPPLEPAGSSLSNEPGVLTSEDGNFQASDWRYDHHLEEPSSCYKKYQDDYEALSLQKAKTDALRSELFKLDYRLRQKQDDFENVIKLVLSTEPTLRNRLERVTSRDRSSSEGSSEDQHSETPPLLSQYFNRKGDVGVYRDRLVELDFNFQDGLVEREFLMDRGDYLGMSDEEFEADYEGQRKVIVAELQFAEQQTQELAELCEAAGIDITATRVPSSSDEHSSPAPSAGKLFASRSVPTPPLPAEASHSIASRRNERSANIIEDWLGNLPHDVESPDAGLIENDADITDALERNGMNQTYPEQTEDGARYTLHHSNALLSVEMLVSQPSGDSKLPNTRILSMKDPALLKRRRSFPADSPALQLAQALIQK